MCTTHPAPRCVARCEPFSRPSSRTFSLPRPTRCVAQPLTTTRSRSQPLAQYVKVLEAQNEILVNFSQFDEFLMPMLSLCSFRGPDASLTPLYVPRARSRCVRTVRSWPNTALCDRLCAMRRLSVHKAGLRALATLLACRSKVPAGDDPSALALDTIVPVVLRVLHSPQAAECVAARCGARVAPR